METATLLDHHGGMSYSRRIIDEATSWPGVSAHPGSRGELSLRYGRREIGHLHGDRAAHFGFPKSVGAQLKAEGRIGPHPAFPDKVAWGARRIASDEDVRDVIDLLRLNYDRVASVRDFTATVGTAPARNTATASAPPRPRR